VSYGLSTATSAIMSRRYGQGDDVGMRRVAWQSLWVVLALGALFGFVGIFGAGFLMHDLVGAKGQVAELGTEYLRVIIGGSLTIFLLLHLTTIQRSLGSSKTPVTMLLVANAINLVLAVLLVYGPGAAPAPFAWGPPLAATLGIPRLGLIGAAWATVIARLIVILPLCVIIVRRFGLFGADSREKHDLDVMRRIWRVGWPSSTQLVVRIVAMLVVHSLVARAYTTAEDQSATTALGIVFRLETMALFVGLGWGSAAQTFVGLNLGAGKLERAKTSGWYAALYNALMMAALATAYRAWGPAIIGFFDERPEVLAIGLSYVNAVGWSYIGLGMGIVLGAAIRARCDAAHAGARFAGRVRGPATRCRDLDRVRLRARHGTTVANWLALTCVSFAVVYASSPSGAFLRTVLPDAASSRNAAPAVRARSGIRAIDDRSGKIPRVPRLGTVGASGIFGSDSRRHGPEACAVRQRFRIHGDAFPSRIEGVRPSGAAYRRPASCIRCDALDVSNTPDHMADASMLGQTGMPSAMDPRGHHRASRAC
jgi:putative MATE family efflux protein